MNSRLSEIANELDKTRKNLLAITSTMTPEELEGPAENQTWSMTQFLHHLYLSEVQITRLVEKKLPKAEPRENHNDDEPESVIHTLDQFEVDAAKIKYNAPSGAAPKTDIDYPQVVKDLETSRAALIEVMNKADNYKLSSVTFPHPAYGALNLYQWLLFLWKHEVRHLRQMEAILS